MGQRQHTNYIEAADPRRVADVMVSLFRREGIRQVAEPRPDIALSPEANLDAGAMETPLWSVRLLPGAAGWTIVKTVPFELLGERAPNAHRMRLVALAGRLGAAAVQINLYDSAFLVLVEIDRRSRCLLSGYGPGSLRNPDPLQFNGEPLDEARIDVRFELLPFQQLVWDSTRYDYAGPTLDHEQLVSRLAQKLGGRNAAWCDDAKFTEILLSRKPFPARNGMTLHFELSAD